MTGYDPAAATESDAGRILASLVELGRRGALVELAVANATHLADYELLHHVLELDRRASRPERTRSLLRRLRAEGDALGLNEALEHERLLALPSEGLRPRLSALAACPRADELVARWIRSGPAAVGAELARRRDPWNADELALLDMLARTGHADAGALLERAAALPAADERWAERREAWECVRRVRAWMEPTRAGGLTPSRPTKIPAKGCNRARRRTSPTTGGWGGAGGPKRAARFSRQPVTERVAERLPQGGWAAARSLRCPSTRAR
jgi:hypothetical protein